MYDQFYGLDREAFRLSPDSRICFRHKSHEQANAYMKYAIHKGEGVVLITGQPGTGKTTLILSLIDKLSRSPVESILLSSGSMSGDELLQMVAVRFGIETAGLGKAGTVLALERHLANLHSDGKKALLLVDEAQSLSIAALDDLRILTNLQLGNQPLLQIFLLGQPKLRELVRKPELEQLHQRIVAACHLKPLDEKEARDYILYRLNAVSWQGDPEFKEELYDNIHHFSGGIPRWINLICSRLLIQGMVEQIHVLGLTELWSVLEELLQEGLLSADSREQIARMLGPDGNMDVDLG